MSWTSYLPPTLQLPTLYFGMAVCLAAVAYCRNLPAQYQALWIVHTITLIVAILFFVPIMGRDYGSIIYAFGTAAICSALAVMFYDVAIAFIVNKVRGFFGMPPANGPVKYVDANNLPPQNQPPTQK